MAENSSNHLVALDGLRGFAALLVFVGHFSSLTKIWDEALGQGGALLGVMLFFVLSGFLMGYLYLPKETSLRSIGTFLRRRFARVYPLFAFVVILSFAMSFVFDDWQKLVYQITTWKYFIQNITAYRGESVLWTIVTELRFYLVFPLIWLIYRKSLWASVFVMVLMIAATFLYSWHYTAVDAPPRPRIMVLLQTGLTMYTGSYFLVGILIAIFLKNVSGFPPILWNIMFAISILLFLSLYPSISPFLVWPDDPSLPKRPFIVMWLNPISLIFTAMVLLSTIKSSLAEHIFGNRVMRFFGKISYSFYIWHMPVMWYLNRFTDIRETPYLFFAIAFPLIILVSLISYHGIEDPARRFLNGRRKRSDDLVTV